MDDDIASTSEGRSPTVDLWVNALSDEAADDFTARPGNERIPDLLGGDLSAASTLGQLVATMDKCEVDHRRGRRRDLCARRPTRCSMTSPPTPTGCSVALVVDRADRPVRQSARLRDLAQHPAVSLVRVTPLVQQYPLNDKLYYPIYTACAEFGLPVSVNVGVPGTPGPFGLPTSPAPRGRPHRLQGPDRDRRPHGTPIRGAA